MFQVHLQGSDETTEALSYRIRSENLDPDLERCKPSRVYKEVMVEGAIENGLPEEYVER